MKITFGLVIYNEEKLIRRALESIKDVAAEIIVVHDGDCSDRTLAIAREYTDQVYTRPHLGGSDPHRIFILNNAHYDWVFMIDADEFLSEELKQFLLHARLNPDFGAYAFKWPLWNGRRSVTTSNYRPCLFNRPKSWFLGLHNFSVQSLGHTEKLDYVLEHQPQENKISFGRFAGQWRVRVERDARQYLKGYQGLEKFNEALIPNSFIKWLERFLAHPRRYAYLNFGRHLIGSLKNTWRDGYYGLLVSLQAAWYQYKLARRVNELKQKESV